MIFLIEIMRGKIGTNKIKEEIPLIINIIELAG